LPLKPLKSPFLSWRWRRAWSRFNWCSQTLESPVSSPSPSFF
jgi:hypothetical protein